MTDPLHCTALALGAIALALSLPGSLELALLSVAGILPARRRGVRAPPGHPGPGEGWRIAAVIPAHDEEGGIARCVESLLACDPAGRRHEVVVIADNCADATASRAAAAGARVMVRTDAVHRGKGHALAWAFPQLLREGFDAVLVVDADSEVSPDLVREIRRELACGADGVQARYVVRNPAASLRTRLMSVALLAFNVLRPRGRDRLGLSVGILGNGFALSRATLQEVPYDACSVVEDLEYHIRLVGCGRTIRFADAAWVSADMPESGHAAATQRARWEGGRLRMLQDWSPELLGGVVRGSPRLLEPLLELMLLPLAYHVLLLLGALLGGIGSGVTGLTVAAVASLALVVAHVLLAIAIGGGGARDLGALLAAPAYVAWKLALAPAIARTSRADAAWVRTARVPPADEAVRRI